MPIGATFKYYLIQHRIMEQIYTFVRRVRKHGRVTIPDEIVLMADIKTGDPMFFAVSDKPFRSETAKIV